MSDLAYLVDLYKANIGDTADTIFDIGSRDGDDAKYLADSLSAKNVFTFEANPDCYTLIENSYPDFKNIYGAISNYKGNANFNMVVSSDWEAVGTSSLKNRSDDWYSDKAKKITVPVNTIKNIIKDYSIPGPLDLVKIDTEGCSFEVLEGFSDEIENVKMFHVENETYQYWQDQKLANEVGNFLQSKGFVLINSYNFAVNSVDEVWINGNIV
jgi:FkbM family methyltransferase